MWRKLLVSGSLSRIDEKENGGQKLQKMVRNDGEETDGLVRRSLKIDETALIETSLPVPTPRIGSTEEVETMSGIMKRMVEKKLLRRRQNGHGERGSGNNWEVQESCSLLGTS